MPERQPVTATTAQNVPATPPGVAFFGQRAATADSAKAQAVWDKVGQNPVPEENHLLPPSTPG